MLDAIFNKTNIPIMNKALQVASSRQKAIASNIANALTPNYKRKEVNFEESLIQAVNHQRGSGLQGLRTDSRHMTVGQNANGGAPVVYDQERAFEDVDVEKEMASSAENQIFYSAVAKIVGGNFKALKTSIRGQT